MDPSEKVSIGIAVLGLIVSVVALVAVFMQLLQANDHKMWENYNGMNLRYYEWYSQKPIEMEKLDCRKFDKTSTEVKTWTRTYFDLYAEEYWLYLNDLIPAEMWTRRIDKGVDVNLQNFPALVRGYEYWKSKGAFSHPDKFIEMVDGKILKLGSKIPKCPSKL